jgi:NADPH:quinone reductase-like Zn-dependent oxidoreductase
VAAVNDGTAGAGAHVILDNMGAAYLERNIATLAEGGRLVVIGLQGGWNGTVNLARIMSKRASVHSTCLRTRPSDGPGSNGQITQDVIEHVWPMISESLVRPVVHAVVPIEHAPNAHRMLDEPGTIGKVLLSVAGNHN